MELEEFIQAVVSRLRGKFGCEYHVEAVDVPKNNGVIFHGVNIMRKDKKIAPCIYLDGYYGRYVDENMAPDAVATDIIRVYEENADNLNFDVSLLTDYNNVRPKLCGRLVNTGKNSALLNDLPHREFLDLSLIYSVEVCGFDKGIGSVLVYNSHIERWNVSEEELYQAVMENMEHTDHGTIQNLAQVITQMAGLAEIPKWLKNDACPMYILSDKKKQNGAVQMLNKRMLKTAAKMFGRDFMVLPSSVHEVLLVPVIKDMEEKDYVVKLKDMIREVNDTQVEDMEILSYHVYRYCADTETVVIAA